jgi:ssDNA-binding Zn-finger/Zn-ribbon topoisomerase 1
MYTSEIYDADTCTKCGYTDCSAATADCPNCDKEINLEQVYHLLLVRKSTLDRQIKETEDKLSIWRPYDQWH